jgi:hypothetical protein
MTEKSYVETLADRRIEEANQAIDHATKLLLRAVGDLLDAREAISAATNFRTAASMLEKPSEPSEPPKTRRPRKAALIKFPS